MASEIWNQQHLVLYFFFKAFTSQVKHRDTGSAAHQISKKLGQRYLGSAQIPRRPLNAMRERKRPLFHL